MLTVTNYSLEFELSFLFKERKEIFSSLDTLREFYEVLYDFDKFLINSIHRGGLPYYSLNNIEYSSIRTRVAQIVRGIPDDALKKTDWKIELGEFLLKAKYWLLKHLEENTKIESKSDLEIIAKKVNSELKKVVAGEELLIDYSNVYFFLNAIAGVQKVVEKISNNELLEYKSKFGTASINNNFSINKGKILAELGNTEIENVTTEILKAKKIELLNDKPTWEFLRGKKKITATMLASNWLSDFHLRKIIIQTNDSLKVRMRTIHTYSNNYSETKTKYEIVEVLEVVKPDKPTTTLFD